VCDRAARILITPALLLQIDRGLQLSTFQGFLYEVTELYQLKRHNILIGVGVSPLPRSSFHTLVPFHTASPPLISF
jgi:hypothetical protein